MADTVDKKTYYLALYIVDVESEEDLIIKSIGRTPGVVQPAITDIPPGKVLKNFNDFLKKDYDA